MTDKDGNPVAPVVGGPDDGDVFFCRDYAHGDTYVPARTASHRPVYRFDATHPAGERFVFVDFEAAS